MERKRVREEGRNRNLSQLEVKLGKILVRGKWGDLKYCFSRRSWKMCVRMREVEMMKQKRYWSQNERQLPTNHGRRKEHENDRSLFALYSN